MGDTERTILSDESMRVPFMPPPYPVRGRVTAVLVKDDINNLQYDQSTLTSGHKTLYKVQLIDQAAHGMLSNVPMLGYIGSGYDPNAAVDGIEVPLMPDTEVAIMFFAGDWNQPFIIGAMPQDSNSVSHATADRLNDRGPITGRWAGSAWSIDKNGAVALVVNSGQNCTVTVAGAGDATITNGTATVQIDGATNQINITTAANININPGAGNVVLAGGGAAVGRVGDNITLKTCSLGGVHNVAVPLVPNSGTIGSGSSKVNSG